MYYRTCLSQKKTFIIHSVTYPVLFDSHTTLRDHACFQPCKCFIYGVSLTPAICFQCSYILYVLLALFIPVAVVFVAAAAAEGR